jgi:hypothetical protein
MFFADKPYISDFFKRTVRDNEIPVVGTEIAGNLGLYKGNGSRTCVGRAQNLHDF